MEQSDILQLGALAVLLAASAFFSASETALMTLGKMRIRHMIDARRKGAETVRKLVESPAKLLGAILVGNNAVNIAASALSTALCIRYFGASGVGISTVAITVLVLIFGEITPKTLAAQNAVSISVAVAGPMRLITVALTPLVAVLSLVTNSLIKLLGGGVNVPAAAITEEELKTVVNVSHEEGVLEPEEREMIHNVVEFGDSLSKDVMTPRVEMVAVDVCLSYGEIETIFRTTQYSRLPVYEGSTDRIIGILNFKDFVFGVRDTGSFDLRSLLRKPYITYAHKNAADLFREMKLAREQIAVIVDEYGGTAGIVTLEDLVEEIVGDIEDEYDQGSEELKRLGDRDFLVMGSVRIDDFNTFTGLSVVSEYSETVAGFIAETLGSVATAGMTLRAAGAEFVVESMTRNRIQKVRVRLLPGHVFS